MDSSIAERRPGRLTAEADQGRHFGVPRFNVFADGLGSLTER
jgi:hypothetical protein